MRFWLFIFCAFVPCLLFGAAPESYPVRGQVIDRLTRRPVAYAAVVVVGRERLGASTDSAGRFVIEHVPPGICRLAVSSLGYKRSLTPEYIVTAAMPPVGIELEEETGRIESVTVTPSTFRHTAESPVSMRVIGLREIEKSPGSNRDVSRIVRSYPGVSFSPVGYRNDLSVRGVGPSENRFFMDGIEIPNINHFATQCASGGPVSIVNADLVREIGFYTGAFPVDRAGGLSSVLDFELRDGNSDRQTFKATVGASEIGASGSGHIGERTTWLFSARRSYLQLLFKLLGLPFLPDYIDGQVKIKSRLSEHDELTFMGLVGFDDMRLNTDEKGEDAQYLLSYLPRLRQETFTAGAVWRHYAGRHTQSMTLSHNYLNNRNLKYMNNDSSTEENLMLRLRAVEQKSSLRFENRSYLNRWNVRAGAELHYRHYVNSTVQRLSDPAARFSDYAT
ncbi:MAG: TonB-dependent receptor, partial [Alistipes sp.]|nr:TonB-dependent receptor [Alistipes sp.]